MDLKKIILELELKKSDKSIDYHLDGIFLCSIQIETLIITVNNNKCENFNNIEKPYLWVYWQNKDGKPTPPIIELCLEIMSKRLSNNFK